MTRNDQSAGTTGEERRVAPLGELDDWELKDGEPDVRGWDVVTETGTRVGDVHELLAEPAARRVRYLDVEVDAIGDAAERHVAFPIGAARIDEDARRVTLAPAQPGLADLPRYRGGAPDRAYESRVARCFGCDEDRLQRYEHPVYDEKAFYPR